MERIKVGLEIGPVLVDAPTTPIAFNYQIVNNGHASYADIESNLAAGAVALTAHVFSSTFWTMIMGVVSKWIWGFIFADCDGPVAVDQFQWTGQDLWNMTHGVGTLSQSKFYPGIDSPWGCGGNSKYYVQWSLAGAGVTTQRVFVISSVSEVFVSA